ncbi:MAG: FkbM family methyltransferase [Planctomycetota bacterium]|nr:MAG: FkbM family methyltransferase [Planctomycetota bacterium]
MIRRENISWALLLGNQLFKHCFPVYNVLYKLYKRFVDRYERALLRDIIKPGMTVVDVGANIGIYTGYMARIVGEKGRVYAFEPSPYTFSLLKKYNKNHHVTLVQAAVGDTTGKITLYLSDKLNVDHHTYETDEQRQKIDVLSYRLDDYLKNEKVDFIKMDIQGFEHKALSGMRNILQTNHEIKVLMEFWPYGLIKAATTPQEILTFLHQLDFKTELIEGKHRKPCPPVPTRNDFSYYRRLLASR